jgi:Ca-activated chloride channel family protein
MGLKPVTFAPQRASKVSIALELRSSLAITGFQSLSRTFPLNVSTQDDHSLKATFEGTGVLVNDDLAISYKVADDHAPRVQAYRTGESGEPGYFEAAAVLGGNQAPKSEPPRTVVVLFDTSLSMQWEKLERSFQALESTLRSLRPVDLFNVVVFNSEAQTANQQVVPASPDAVAKALDFVRASRLRGGTDIQKALKSAFAQIGNNTYIVLLSDGELTEGTVSPVRFEAWLDKTWRAIPNESRPHLYALSIGDDANLRLMRRLAAHAGVFEQVGSTETLDLKLSAFIKKIGLTPLGTVALSTSPANFDMVYRLGQDNFPGGVASWVGQYRAPAAADFTVATSSGGPVHRLTTHFVLPAVNTVHAYLPATWARARVDALLEKIDRDGEDKAGIDEIIRLSRKYKFVTPYTSFLAAPRALLRPRLIRPGDPVLRVRTDASMVSLIALFPFGAIKPLHYIKQEDIWQTRFVAPDDMSDGTHTVRLILRDRQGRVYLERKTFLISSHPPIVRVQAGSGKVHAGDRLTLRVQASETTRTITARLYGVEPITLRWDESRKANTGVLAVPANLPPGRYDIHVTAEDIAHNVSHQEVPLEVFP